MYLSTPLCMHVSMHVCMYVHMYLRTYICIYVRMHVEMIMYMYVSVHITCTRVMNSFCVIQLTTYDVQYGKYLGKDV